MFSFPFTFTIIGVAKALRRAHNTPPKKLPHLVFIKVETTTATIPKNSEFKIINGITNNQRYGKYTRDINLRHM